MTFMHFQFPSFIISVTGTHTYSTPSKVSYSKQLCGNRRVAVSQTQYTVGQSMYIYYIAYREEHKILE